MYVAYPDVEKVTAADLHVFATLSETIDFLTKRNSETFEYDYIRSAALLLHLSRLRSLPLTSRLATKIN
jgi:hypothetical protein